MAFSAARGEVIIVAGACTLIGAINNANTDSDTTGGACPAGSGTDEIHLTDSVGLTGADNSVDGPNALPSVTSEIRIVGTGTTVIARSSSSPFRILHVAESGDLTLEGVAIQGGRSLELLFDGVLRSEGGGIFNLGRLTLRHSSVQGNTAETLSCDPWATPPDEPPECHPAYTYGGGIYNGPSATLIVSFTTVSGNSARDASHDVEGSDAQAFGGGVFSAAGASLTVTGSTVSGNGVRARRGAEGGGIFSAAGASLTLTDSTVSGNQARALLRAEGGGIANRGSSAILTNVTLSDNSVAAGSWYPEAIGHAYGGGIDNEGPMTVTHATFSGNSAFVDAPDCCAFYCCSAFSGGVELRNSVIGVHPWHVCSGGGIDLGNNRSDDPNCPASTPLTGLDPALADNGGPTLTHALLAGSNAIDFAGSCGLATDQRAAQRSDGACDSGAFEFAGCPMMQLADDTVIAAEIYEECEIRLGPNLGVVGPEGDLRATAGARVVLLDGFEVGIDGALTITIDPGLQMPATAR